MRPITVIIVEDDEELSDGLKAVLESQKIFPCEVHVLNPSAKNRTKAPTFEEFNDEIEAVAEAAWPYYIVLMDNDLRWRWKGANLAPSFMNVISISNAENVRWADYHFADKAAITFHHDETAKQEFLAVVTEVLKKMLPQATASEPL